MSRSDDYHLNGADVTGKGGGGSVARRESNEIRVFLRGEASRWALMLASLAMFALGTAHAASGRGRENDVFPAMSLLYQTAEQLGGELRLCQYPSEYERVLWRWRAQAECSLSRPFYSVSPDGRRALVVQEGFLQRTGQGQYTFALVHLDDAGEAAKPLRLKAKFASVSDYPVWLDSARVLLGVTDEWKGDTGYRELYTAS
jgi:hypothetical protein